MVAQQTCRQGDKLKRLLARARRHSQRSGGSTEACTEAEVASVATDSAFRDGRCGGAEIAGVLTDCFLNAATRS